MIATLYQHASTTFEGFKRDSHHDVLFFALFSNLWIDRSTIVFYLANLIYLRNGGKFAFEYWAEIQIDCPVSVDELNLGRESDAAKATRLRHTFSCTQPCTHIPAHTAHTTLNVSIIYQYGCARVSSCYYPFTPASSFRETMHVLGTCQDTSIWRGEHQNRHYHSSTRVSQHMFSTFLHK